MTRPTARVLALLELLQAGGTRTAADLAGRLGVDERTLRRYVDHLVDLEIPIRAVRGRYGGYRLAAGFRLPPLMFTDAEAVAVLLGLLTGRRSGLAPTSVAAAESAAAKVRRVLPAPLARRLDALLTTVGFTAPDRPAAVPETALLLTLAGTARDRRPVTIRYTDRAGAHSERTVHPYGIVAHAGHWYLTAGPAHEERTFRLDRIAAITVLPGTFDPPADADPAGRLVTSFAEAPYRYAVSVLVAGTSEDLRERLPRAVVTVTAAEHDGWVRLRLGAERLDWVAPLLAGLDRPFLVEEPAELRDHVRALARRLERFSSTGSRAPTAGSAAP